MKVTNFVLDDKFTPVDSNEPRVRKMQILRVGTFTDPRYGKFDITSKMLDEMVKNFSEGVRGVRPALDYKHDSDDKAAGWFKKLYVKGEELWAEIEMTPAGEKVLSDKEFGYTSADFDTNYQDNETLKKFGCVLLGAGLTNRPAIKRMESVIQLSEKTAEKNKGAGMNEEEKKMLADAQEKAGQYKKLEEDMQCADPAAIMQMILDLKKKVADLEAGNSGAMEKEQAAQVALTESKKELSELKEKLGISEKTTEFTKLLSEGKAVEAQREAFVKGDMADFVAKAQPIKLSEQGHNGNPAPKPAVGTEEEQVLKLAEKLVTEEKISMKEAISKVLSENKNLADKIR